MSDWLNSLLNFFELSWEQSANLMVFISSFLSATILPGSSEAALIAALSYSSQSPYSLVLIASIGNALGGFTNFLIGLWLPNRTESEKYSQKGIRWLKRYGYWALLLSWLPIIGDVLCLAAGWLRMKPVRSLIFIFCGKAVRYSMLAFIFLGVF